MRKSVLAILAVVLVSVLNPRAEAAIEAIPGRTYKLTDRHGPWMIMITSFSGTERQDDARDAADQLVLALRKKGIPAYVFEQETRKEYFASADPLGQQHRRVFAAQRPMVAVLAGNYKKMDDPIAQKTLDWIKNPKNKFAPEIHYKSANTGATKTYKPSLQKAFLTRNPLRPEGDERTRDPLLEQLNSGSEYSLLRNKGRYTLIVATFYGTAKVKPSGFAQWDMKLRHETSLDDAAENAWGLCKVLREHPRVRELKADAYVYHERYRSVVTVGSFNSPDDPRVEQVRKLFQAKYRTNESTKEDVLVAEWLQIPGRQNASDTKGWVLDPVPELLEVPR